MKLVATQTPIQIRSFSASLLVSSVGRNESAWSAQRPAPVQIARAKGQSAQVRMATKSRAMATSMPAAVSCMFSANDFFGVPGEVSVEGTGPTLAVGGTIGSAASGGATIGGGRLRRDLDGRSLAFGRSGFGLVAGIKHVGRRRAVARSARR